MRDPRVLDDAPGRRMESDELDALVARETGLAAQTIRNLRAGLKNDGLIRPVPVKDQAGLVERWLIERTNAPRADRRTVSGDPATVLDAETPGFGSTTPQTVQQPVHPHTVTGRKSEPVTETRGIGDLDAAERLS